MNNHLQKYTELMKLNLVSAHSRSGQQDAKSIANVALQAKQMNLLFGSLEQKLATLREIAQDNKKNLDPIFEKLKNVLASVGIDEDVEESSDFEPTTNED